MGRALAVIAVAGVVAATAVVGSSAGAAIIVALVSVLGALVSVIAIRARNRGREGGAPAAEAERFGLAYEAKGSGEFRSRWAGLPEVRSDTAVRHVMTGLLDGRELTVFQTTHMVYTGQAMVEVAHTVYATAAPAWPDTHVVPRGFFGRLLRRLGRPSGLLLENRDFNARFRIQSRHEDFAVALLSPEMQAFMLTKPSVRWRVLPGRVCLIYPGRLRPQRLEASLRRLRDFWLRVPPELEAW